ncbi:MAG TPA: hypothetical protein VJC11_03500 [Patescibacteria group bacterium]|nr:hypothetical protein [Patescibacteria group bacterium]
MDIEVGGESLMVTILGWINQGPFVFALNVFINGGWIPVLILVLYGFYYGWLNNRQGKYVRSLNLIFLAIDVPKNNEQTPKAVEQIFAHMAGAWRRGTKWQRYWEGYVQPWFTFEIISVEGYIQFLIGTPEKYRDLVEAAVYAQYPDAEITQVEDYTKGFDVKTFFQTHDLWGTELALKNNQAYPIRTYPQFEHVLSGEFLDPLGSFMEILGRMGRGEQMWFQICVRPIDESWKKNADALVRKLIGMKKASTFTVTGGISQALQETFQEAFNQIGGGGSAEGGKKSDAPPSLMQHLSPGDRTAVEGIQLKISKLGFQTKIRMIYLAHKDVMNKGKGVEGFMGSMRPFQSLDMNGLTVEKYTKTSAEYFFKKQRIRWRQEKLLRSYKYRSLWHGGTSFVLNTEELATLYHFPTPSVRAPLLKRTEAKRGEPPFAIPIVDREETLRPQVTAKPVEAKEAAPTDLPIVD